MAAGGLISLVRSLPTIWHGLSAGLRDFRSGRADATRAETAAVVPRTDRDLPISFVGIGMIVLIVGIIATPALQMNFLGALLIIVFGFLFVTVSSRLTGEIGSSSNPISGMTVATLLFTCLIFLLIGKTGGGAYVTALSVGAIVCIAASNGGTTSQDLKTGYLLGSTPKLQQIAILFGAFASALALGPILLLLNTTKTVYVPAAQAVPSGLVAPADARSRLAGENRRSAGGCGHEGVSPLAKDERRRRARGQIPRRSRHARGGLAGRSRHQRHVHATARRHDGGKVPRAQGRAGELHHQGHPGAGELPWALVLLGVMIAVVLELSGIPSLAFAVGVYLPLYSSAPIFIGGSIRWLVDARQRRHLRSRQITLSEEELVAESDKSPGVLLASGYIAGGAIAGIIVALIQGVFVSTDHRLAEWAKAHIRFMTDLGATRCR